MHSYPLSQPLSLMKVTSPQTQTSDSSPRTVRRRSHEMAQLRDVVSKGDSATQLQGEMKALTADERQQLMTEANFSIDIPPEHGLAMKADLCLPWNKLRVLRRWERVFTD